MIALLGAVLALLGLLGLFDVLPIGDAVSIVLLVAGVVLALWASLGPGPLRRP